MLLDEIGITGWMIRHLASPFIGKRFSHARVPRAAGIRNPVNPSISGVSKHREIAFFEFRSADG
jgi:hypothetical protein